MRADSLAQNLQNNSHNDFWKEVRMMNNCKTSIPSNIDGVSGADEISQLWQKHYSDLFNCVKTNSFSVGSLDNNENAIVSTQEVYEEFMKLVNNKACGLDNITAENSLAKNSILCLLFVLLGY